MSKSTQTQMKRRERRIVELIAQGCTRQEVGDMIAAEFKCTPLAGAKQYDKLIKSLMINTTEDRETQRAVFLTRFEQLFKRALEKENFKTASEIIEKQAKLMGLYDKDAVREAPPSIRITGPKPLEVVPKLVNDEEL